jgi:hypothetical protein
VLRLNRPANVMLVAACGNNPPTESAIAVRDELTAAIDAQLEAVLGPELDAFNKQIADLQLPAIAKQK